jgi:endonuclease/exonuclease/phosphatase family metal-dependent hydrolase
MKLISLNVWGGAIHEPLLKFLEENADVDFFLFQEMHHNATEKTNWNNRGNSNLFEDIKKILPNHVGYFAPAQDDEYGLAGFISNKIELLEHGDIFIHRHKDAMSNMDGTLLGRNLQYFKVAGEKPYTLMNFHGLWTGTGKQDTEERIIQSNRITEFAKSIHGEFVLAGDFNLMPDTESIRILERMGLRNLIKDYGITNTRTSYYKKTSDKFADYVFVTGDIRVQDFQIMPEEVSDHAAMYLEFEL